MSFFPKIKFIDYVYEFPLSDCDIDNKVSPTVTGRLFFETNTIYVLRLTKDKLVLLHELSHWLIGKISRSGAVHDWFDKYFTVKNQKQRG